MADGHRLASSLKWAAMAALFALHLPAFADVDRVAKEAELKQLRERIAVVQRELDKVRGQYDGLREELRQVETRIGTLSRSLAQIEGDLGKKRVELASLNQERASLNLSLESHREHLADQVRATYAMGRQEYVKILLNQEDPTAVGRVITYYDYLNRARTERITALRETLKRLAQVEKEIARESLQLQALKSRQQSEKRTLQGSYDKRSKVMAQLKRELESKGSSLEQMRADEEELKALVKALVEALSDIPPEAGNYQPFGEMKGKLQWPVKGRIRAGFGAPRSQAGLRWQGIVIDGDEGDDVRAVSHGRVAFSDWLRGYGLLMIVDHDDGYMSLYGHNQSLLKETGDWVEAGEVIAYVGNSGGQDETGLYFEIRQDGRPRDPVGWISRR